MEYISFPGLGIEPFHMSKTAFTLFGRGVAWYGIIICVGIILAVLYGMFRAKTEKLSSDNVIDLSFFLVFFGIIGARLYYVIFEFENYLVTGKGFLGNLGGTLKNIVSIWNGGLAIYGALIAGFLTILIFCRVKKIKLLKLLDLASPAVMIGQIIGRWGNFVNMEAHGVETTLPWRMGLLTKLDEDWYVGSYVHPTFLYESLWNLLGFVIANIIYRKKKFDGQIFYFYIGWYGFGRMLIEGLRTDSLMIGGAVRVSQIVGLLTFIAGAVLTVIFAKRARKARIAAIDGAFEPVECISDSACESDEADEQTADIDTVTEDMENGEDN